MYIGWSILPSNVVRDNYGHYVMNKFCIYLPSRTRWVGRKDQ